MYNEITAECVERPIEISNSCEEVKPNKRKIRTIVIKEFDHGYLVEVGCKAFVFEFKEKMLDYLFNYINYPDKTEELYDQGKLFPNKM
jgi:hypothetical protein